MAGPSEASKVRGMSQQLGTPFLRARARRLARDQAGVLVRRQLKREGIPRWLLQLEVRAGRWQRTGRQSVVVHNGPLSPETRRAVAAAEVCTRAALDGPSALQQWGVKALDEQAVHVIAPKGSTPRRPPEVLVHESRRFREDDVVLVRGVRTVRPAVAAVHAALWARSDRQATFYLVLVVQQQLATSADLADAVDRVRRHPRRRLLRRVLLDVTLGVRSMGELDVAQAMRARGLPEPDRQVLRRRPSGTEYLDVRLDRYRLTLEIDGEQHDELGQRVADVLRDFTLVAEGDHVLRLPLAVWRVAQEQVLDRLEQVLRARGWRPPPDPLLRPVRGAQLCSSSRTHAAEQLLRPGR